MPIALILALAPLDISFLKENGGQINASKHPNNNVCKRVSPEINSRIVTCIHMYRYHCS